LQLLLNGQGQRWPSWAPGVGLDHDRVLSSRCPGSFISRLDALLSVCSAEEYTFPPPWQDTCSHIRPVQVLESIGELGESWKWSVRFEMNLEGLKR